MAKLTLIFAVVFLIAFAALYVANRKQRKATWKFSAKLILPGLFALIAVLSALALSLAPPVKVI